MATGPDEEQLRWAMTELGCEMLLSATGLRDGGAPWLLECAAADGSRRRAVLRIGDAAAQTPQRESAGMRAAARAGLPVPAVLAERMDGPAPLLLIEYLDGSSRLPLAPDPVRLRSLGALAARVSAVDASGEDLPLVTHPIPLVDFDALRAEAEPQPLLVEAQARVAEREPADPIGFTHGDLWSGNVLWRGTELAGVLDWDCAGRGTAGIDLGSLRCDAAMCYGGGAPDEVLAGWQDEAGRSADSLAYWDAVAALSTPPDISWFAPAISGMTGRPDLTSDILRSRRDAFLAGALERLD